MDLVLLPYILGITILTIKVTFMGDHTVIMKVWNYVSWSAFLLSPSVLYFGFTLHSITAYALLFLFVINIVYYIAIGHRLAIQNEINLDEHLNKKKHYHN